MNEWNIQSRAHACQSCGKGFSDQQPYHTLLVDLKHEVQRLDVCEACWKNEHGEGARDRLGFISHWQGVYEVPAAAPPEAIRKENAESLLRKIMERNDPRYAAAAYILAAMLERKRILKVKEQLRRDGQRLFLYEHAKNGDIFTIPDQNLQLNQPQTMETVQREVAFLLEHGLDAEAGIPPGSSPSALPASDEAALAPAPPGGEEPTSGPAPAETASAVP